MIAISTSLFLIKVAPAARKDGSVILHYSVYLGSDDVRSWAWTFFWPAVWLATTLVGLIWAFGVYQRDPHLSYGLIAVNFLWCLPWIGVLFYLTLINE